MEDEKNHEDSFGDLLEAYTDRTREDLQLGDKLKGKIISIGPDYVFVDTGTKIDGVVEREQLLDQEGEMPFKEGDMVELYVTSFDGNEIRLSKTLSGSGDLRIMAEAFRKEIPVEGRVKGKCKGGFNVEVMGKRAFCPISQMDLKYVEDPDKYLGETFPFLITQLEDSGRNIVLSRRVILERELHEKKQSFIKELDVDMELTARVTKLMPYGAFVELIPGVEGMVHISEISWSRLEKPEEVLRPGDIVTVKILGMAEGKRPGEKKISLSMKQVTGDPWDSVGETFHVGEKVMGKVTRCTRFGAFVEIAPGVEGLVHISEMSYGRRILKPEDVVSQGEKIAVMIKEMDPENRRISLSIKEAEGDPWVTIGEKYAVGQTVQGVVEGKEKFGLFVSLEPGITGLVPMSRIRGMSKSSPVEKLRPGDPITVVVEDINQEERKITLAPGDTSSEAEWQRYAENSRKSMGSLGEKLQAALKAKNG
ncbi:MAG: 30S ribosomal protein S1 [Deltaproteobacteria bacterium]|nr:30S ribosomal protein S1 [Deltaproteobacteria bacterium]